MNTDTSTIAMDQEMAKKLLAEGAVLIIAGVPTSTEFGIDLCSYTIGENFRGVKMIPPGPHFVWCAAQSAYGVGPRSGFMHYFSSGEIVIREWDNNAEELRTRQIADPELEHQRIRQHICDLDRFLAPYDYRYAGAWKQLTDDVTKETVKRCQPETGIIRTNMELQSCPDAERPRGASKAVTLLSHNNSKILDENDLLPQLTPIEGTAPRFVKLPDRVPKDAEPSDISLHSIDCIAAIDTLVNCFPTTKELDEEIQLAFVFFLIGHSVESLTHWRRLLHLLSHSETAVDRYKLFYMKYSEVLGHQLPHLPEELLVPSKYNSVYKDVRELLINMHANGLGPSANRLSNKLGTSLQWDFPDLLDVDPEDLPVLVASE